MNAGRVGRVVGPVSADRADAGKLALGGVVVAARSESLREDGDEAARETDEGEEDGAGPDGRSGDD